MPREQTFRIFFVIVFVLLVYQIARILSPFYTGILGAIVLTLIFFPLHRLILHGAGPHRPNTSAAASTLLVLTLIVVPFGFFAWLLFKELMALYPVMIHIGKTVEAWKHGDELFIKAPWLQSLDLKLQEFFDLTNINLQEVMSNIANSIVNFVAAFGKKVPGHIFLFVFNMLVMIFTMFFLFRDGENLFRKLKEILPMEQKHKDHIAEQLYLTVTAVVRGVFVVAVAQGTVAAIGFAIAGLPSPVALGFCTLFVALIPFLGAVSVWLPISIYYLLQGFIVKGIFLFVYGALVISLVDNVLRAFLIGSKAKLPILFLFFGILGGIKVYGPMGLFLGPLLIALVFAFIKIYREEYSHEVKRDN